MSLPSYAPSSSPLTLPDPPPAPGASHTRSPSAASAPGSSGMTIHPSAPPETKQEEPTVDDLLRETHECQTLISTISSQLDTVESLRDEVIALALACPPEKLAALAQLTTSTGSLILSLSSPLASLSSRIAHVSALAAQGQAAALPTEIARIEEELEALRLIVRQNVERVRQAAWGEVQSREGLRRRVEERIRSENLGLTEAQVGRSTDAAMQGVGAKVATLELDSYVGRVAAETPFAELAQLIDDAANERRKSTGGEAVSLPPFLSVVLDHAELCVHEQLERENTRTSLATTLVGSTDEYAKFELGEEGDGAENQPLAGGVGVGTGFGAAELGGLAGEGAKLSRWMKLRMNWKDYLVRTMLFTIVIGVIVGIIVYESLNQTSGSTDSTASGSATAAATST
ncbi:hypothetical protein JCM1840_001591 [Sporobolomyces johnsonii]